MAVDHLAHAKENLAIAESTDAKREAYKRAANHIAAHREQTSDTLADIAISLKVSHAKVKKLGQWRRTGFKAETPFLMDEQATTRAARSHAKALVKTEPKTIAKVIVEAPPEQRKQIIEALAEDETTEGEVTEASIEAAYKKKAKKRPTPHKLRRKGALDAHGAVIGHAHSAENQAKLALESWRSADETIPDDLVESALESAESAIAAWELVKATIKGESVGDEAEAFLANRND